MPPIGVYIVSGCGADLLINICLTLLGFVNLISTPAQGDLLFYPASQQQLTLNLQIHSRPHSRILPRIRLLRSPRPSSRGPFHCCSCSRCLQRASAEWRQWIWYNRATSPVKSYARRPSVIELNSKLRGKVRWVLCLLGIEVDLWIFVYAGMKRVCLGYWNIPLFAMRSDKEGNRYAGVL